MSKTIDIKKVDSNFINNEAKVFIIGGIIAYLKFSIINNNFDNFETNLFNIINKLTNN